MSSKGLRRSTMEETLTTGSGTIPSSLMGLNSQLKKRKRLNAVLDKITTQRTTNNNPAEDKKTSGKMLGGGSEDDEDRAAIRRELWRETQQKSVDEQGDFFLKNRKESKKLPESESDLESDVFSPVRSPISSLDSPRICFSPLRIKDSIEEEEENSSSSYSIPKFNVPPKSEGSLKGLSGRSVSPNPASLQSLRHFPSYLTEIYRRRCLSDTDLSAKSEKIIPPLKTHLNLPSLNTGSLESRESDSQDSPLDLSVRSSVSSTTGRSSSVESVSSKPRVSLEIVETTTKGNPDISYACPICGQMFSLHDRLAKHMASRHKSRSTESNNGKAYGCEVCKRSFARSDMLTRHMRLHTGIKPYTCRICGQVFSRSDHLSTHQRTHTGEKPYRCPSCPYAACRRDMITRHMRTHARYDLSESTSTEETSSLPTMESSSILRGSNSRSLSSESDLPSSESGRESHPKPPSPMDTSQDSNEKSRKTSSLTSDNNKR